MTMNRKLETVPRAESDVRNALFHSDTVPAKAAAHTQTKGIRL